MTLYHSEKNQNKVFGKGLGVTPRSAGRCPEGTEGTGACQAEPFLRKVSPNKSRNTSVWVSRLYTSGFYFYVRTYTSAKNKLKVSDSEFEGESPLVKRISLNNY